MEPLGMKYRATRNITLPDAPYILAYAEGDLVSADAVEGPAAWLVLGVDVEAKPGADVPEPAKNAPQPSWAAFAVSKGADPDTAHGSSRADLIKKYGSHPAPAGKAAS
jgi:hypothetical protein